MRKSLQIEDNIKSKIIELYTQFESLEKLSKQFNYSVSTIRKLLAKNNISIRKRWKESSLIQHKNKILQLYQENNLSPAKIGKVFSVHGATITDFLQKNGVALRTHAESTTNNGRHNSINNYIPSEKLSKLVTKLYTENYFSTKEISIRLNLSRKKVCHILNISNVRIRNGKFQRKYKLNDYYFDQLDDFNKNYYLGLLFSDGCNAAHQHSISLGLKSEDKYILYNLAKLLNISHIDATLKDYYPNKFSCFSTLKVTSTHMSEILSGYGCVERKSLILKFPNNFNNDYLDAFCLGYFDGDGCICKSFDKVSRNFYYVWSLAGSHDFLFELADRLDSKLSLSMQLNPHGSISELTASEQESLYKLYRFLYNRPEIFLKRKKIIFDDFVKKYESKHHISI